MAAVGQSPWYDGLSRSLLESGRIATLIAQDGLLGITSNPTIFQKAIGQDDALAIRQAVLEGLGVKAIYERLVVREIQGAADLLLPVYEKTEGRDGFVSLEISPALAEDTQGSMDEALHLFHACGRRNVMIKIPATEAGILSIAPLIAHGIPLNITLLFDVEMYERVAWAYIAGLEQATSPLHAIASVASFFISRIDVAVDQALSQSTLSPAHVAALSGKVAIANAQRAYRKWNEIVHSQRFEALRKRGAQPQRLLWASTGTKNPAYPDTYYVEALMAPHTVNTMPEATYLAFRDHGRVLDTFTEQLETSESVLCALSERGIDLSLLTRQLLEHGVRLFDQSFSQLMGTVAQMRADILREALPKITLTLGIMTDRIETCLSETINIPRMLWKREGYPPGALSDDLGWLNLPQWPKTELLQLERLTESMREFRDVLLLGIGGSVLGVDALRRVLKPEARLHIVDTLYGIPCVAEGIDAAHTLCMVSSKSGATQETLCLLAYFYEDFRKKLGEAVSQHFIAITNSGSPLEQQAKSLGLREILQSKTNVGGRYSVLSLVGMLPAALMGIDVRDLLYRANRMRQSCEADIPASDHPGVRLGFALAEAARAGQDKITFVLSSAMTGMGLWLEQLIAESSGKGGRGFIPIVHESFGLPEVYGNDRLFVWMRFLNEPADDKATAQITAIERLKQAGHPVIQIDFADRQDIGQAFYLWEIATAAASARLGVYPFDQPDVEEGKRYARHRLESVQESSPLPPERPDLVTEGMQIFGCAHSTTWQDALLSHFAKLAAGDYFAVMAYLDESYAPIIQSLCETVRNRKQVATMGVFGPRYLHAAAQLYRGGPNCGLFLQLTAEDIERVLIPSRPYTFGTMGLAEALGDFQCLKQRGRRILRLHFTEAHFIASGLQNLQHLLDRD